MHLPISPLFVPGDRPERFAKAEASGADAVILDLEDAVDASVKDAARANVQAFQPSGETPFMVRLNGADTEYWDEDLKAIAARTLRPAALLVPKAESLDALAEAAKLAPVIALIESARGMARLESLLSVQGVVGLAFGSLDYALDLGCSPDWEPLTLARQTLVFQAKLAGLPPPIDGVTPVFDNPGLIEADAARARAMGFGGKLAIHPRQLEPIRKAFVPTEAEQLWAKRVIEAATSDSAISVDGRMIDKPLVEAARQVLLRAGAKQ